MAPTSDQQRLLVVEDDHGVRLSLRVAFERQGFLVAEAASGAEALERAPLWPPDVAILDLMLPDVDGIELFHRLRRLYPDLPIV
ncbi:MAG TPA: response regulator, partial [Chloroflexota bacterium]